MQEESAAAPLHETNEWGIEIAGDDGEGEAAPPSAGGAPTVGEGVEYAHVSSSQQRPDVREDEMVANDDETSLGDLMAQLKGVQAS